MTTTLSGPMFEGAEDEFFRSVHGQSGGHYNNFAVQRGRELDALRLFFPEAAANERNVVLFSTSGVHGSYSTLEEIEASLRKYGDREFGEDEDAPDDWCPGHDVTFLIVQPRLCTVRHGNVRVTLENIEWLKKLRATSHAALARIGMPEGNEAAE